MSGNFNSEKPGGQNEISDVAAYDRNAEKRNGEFVRTLRNKRLENIRQGADEQGKHAPLLIEFVPHGK